MKSSATYTSGEFSKRSNVSIRTIRYYDNISLLKPSYVSESGYRLYTDLDFIKLQKIIVLKNLGFSLDDIRSMIRVETDTCSLMNSFDEQLKLIHSKMNELKQMEHSLLAVRELISETQQPDWKRMIPLLHLMNMQEDLTEQYKNSRNTSIRIHLHQSYSTNPEGWYRWIYSKAEIHPGETVLELGCGNGQLWSDNSDRITKPLDLTMNDSSEGMLLEAKKRMESLSLSPSVQVTYECFDCNHLPYPAESFDLIFANHLLFYVRDLSDCLSEIHRTLKPGGRLICTTYGSSHMKEIEQLVKEFDSRIALSEINLYELFGLEHGKEQLSQFFSLVEQIDYEDSLLVTNMEDLLDYIYSCHGNQMTYLRDSEERFERFLVKKSGKHGFRITKEAGLFLCYK